MSRLSLSTRACSVLTSEKQWVVQSARFSTFIMSACRGFADTHGTADDYKVLYKADDLIGN